MSSNDIFQGASEASRHVWIKLRSSINAIDVYTAVIMVVYSLLSLVYYRDVANASSVIVQDAMIGLMIMTVVLMASITGNPLFSALRYFYVIPVIYLMYDQTHVFVHVVHHVDYDAEFIAADRWLFGTDPTTWLERFSFPALTEYLQLCYFLFYLMPIMQAWEWWRKGEKVNLDMFARGITFCYYISYLLYFIMPAIGPRFTLHNFHTLDVDLPGLLLTPWLRDIIDVGGGVARNMANPELFVNRDCMPSGHTMMTLVNILFAFQLKSRFRWFFTVVGGSLIFSTVYLRYHYGVDVLVGSFLALTMLPLEPRVNAWIGVQKKRWSSV